MKEKLYTLKYTLEFESGLTGVYTTHWITGLEYNSKEIKVYYDKTSVIFSESWDLLGVIIKLELIPED